MGYAFMIAPCGECHKQFVFNPLRVPSLNNVPFCKDCIDGLNARRKKKGLEPFPYADDAYTCCNENELT